MWNAKFLVQEFRSAFFFNIVSMATEMCRVDCIILGMSCLFWEQQLRGVKDSEEIHIHDANWQKTNLATNTLCGATAQRAAVITGCTERSM